MAKKDGDDYVLNGQKTFITNGTRASFITLLAKTNPDAGAHGCSFFLVPTDLKGFRVGGKLEKIGNHASDTAELFFDDLRIPKRYLLGEENMGFMYLMQNFQSERLIGCGERAGWRALGRGVLAQVRRGARGVRQADHQARGVAAQVRGHVHQAGDGGRVRRRVVERFNEEKYIKKENVSFESVKQISMAKIVAGELVAEIMDRCLQFHGGWGYVEEYPIARAWRDARLLKIGGGTSETMTYYLAKLMGL